MDTHLLNVMLGDNPAMNLQPIQGFNLVEILLLASCHRDWSTSLIGHLSHMQDVTLYLYHTFFKIIVLDYLLGIVNYRREINL